MLFKARSSLLCLHHIKNCVFCYSYDNVYKLDKLFIAGGYNDTSRYRDTGDFILTGIKSMKTSERYECCDEVYVDITYIVSVKRKTGAYGAKLVLPSVLTGFLVLATFLLPTGSHEKITLCAVLFLCLLLLMTYLHSKQRRHDTRGIPGIRVDHRFHRHRDCSFGLQTKRAEWSAL